MKKIKHIGSITLIKNAFPKEWKDEYMELLKYPNDDWIRYPLDQEKFNTLFEGPKISNTTLGKRWRDYAFNKWKDEFGITDTMTENYEDIDGIYWGDFILEFKEGHYLIKHKDIWNSKEFRFNVLLNKPSQGGVYSFNGKRFEMDEGDMVVFAPFHQVHETDKVVGDEPRVILSLSFTQGTKPASSLL